MSLRTQPPGAAHANTDYGSWFRLDPRWNNQRRWRRGPPTEPGDYILAIGSTECDEGCPPETMVVSVVLKVTESNPAGRLFVAPGLDRPILVSGWHLDATPEPFRVLAHERVVPLPYQNPFLPPERFVPPTDEELEAIRAELERRAAGRFRGELKCCNGGCGGIVRPTPTIGRVLLDGDAVEAMHQVDAELLANPDRKMLHGGFQWGALFVGVPAMDATRPVWRRPLDLTEIIGDEEIDAAWQTAIGRTPPRDLFRRMRALPIGIDAGDDTLDQDA